MPKRKSDCEARQHGDQMICGRCRLQWDVSDPEPPKCERHKPAVGYLEACAPIPLRTIHVAAPETLSDELAGAMVRTYRANEAKGATTAMRLAYRVFLDRIAP